MFVVTAPSRGGATQGMGTSAAKKETSLYDGLGKKAGTTKVVNDFVTNVGGDSRINHSFAHADLTHLKNGTGEPDLPSVRWPVQVYGQIDEGSAPGYGHHYG